MRGCQSHHFEHIVGSKADTWANQALDYALNTDSPYVATAYMKPPPGHIYDLRSRWVVYMMPSRQDLDGWYQALVASPDRYHYAAAFDKTASEWRAGRPVALTAEPSAYTSGTVHKLDRAASAVRSSEDCVYPASKENEMNTYGDYVGSDGSFPEIAARAVRSASHQSPSPVYGYFRAGLQQKIYLFGGLEDAHGWLTALVHGQAQPYDYAAVFAASDLSQPVPGLESYGHTAVSGDAYVGADGPVLIPEPPENAHYREASVQAVMNAHQQRSSPFYGYFRAGIYQKVYLFPSLEDAFAWFNSVADDRVRRQKRGEAANYDYMAIFIAQDLRNPLWHEFPHFWDPHPHSVSGDAAVGSVWPLLLGLPLGALGGYFYRGWQEKHPGQWIPGISGDVSSTTATSDLISQLMDAVRRDDQETSIGLLKKIANLATQGDPVAVNVLKDIFDQQGADSQVGGSWVDIYGPGVGGPWLDMVGPQVGGPWVDMVGEGSGYTVGGPWLDLVGAQAYQTNERAPHPRAWPQTRALIQSAINEVANVATAAPAAAYVWSLDPPGASPLPQVELEGATMVVPLASLDQALDYMRNRIQTPHVALALFDRTSPHWPNPVNWTKSNDPAYEPAIAAQAAKAARSRPASAYVGATSIGAAIDDVRSRAQSLANKRAGRVIGVIHTPKDNLWHALGFNNEDDADDWLNLQTQDQAAYTYAAYFDKNDATWPHPVIEKIGGVGEPPTRRGRGTSHDWVGAAFDDARKRAAQLATAASGNAAGAIHTADGLWHSLGFRSLDDAIDWLQAATTNKASFTYAAAFEKSSDGTAYVQQEEFGGVRGAPAPGPLIHRGIATTSGDHTWWAA